MLFENSFYKIKSFIINKDNIKREEIIVSHNEDVIMLNEKINQTRYPGHIIVFFIENGCIFAKITFLGCKIYKVYLGEAPHEFQYENFGCGHFLPQWITQFTA